LCVYFGGKLLIRLVLLFYLFTSTESLAGYHNSFNQGFDGFAEEQGFKSFYDYKKKVDVCANMLLKIFDNNAQSSLGEKVYPPEGYHWMNDDGHYTLMQDPSSGYSKHPGSSLTADVPIFPKFLPQPKNIDLEIKSSTDTLSLEVVPPDQYHWMSNGSSYSLMKTPRSGYGPHPGSSLVANFKIYQHNQSVRKSSGEGTEYRGPGLSSASTKASNLLYETLGKARATDVTNLFQKIDKQLWNKNTCSLKMFVHPDILANITEANITGKEISPSDIKVPNSASEWGY
tara:strand:+ start:11 stop:868 length:858 start_codon:yes stop_codon:yes gene_type:complete